MSDASDSSWESDFDDDRELELERKQQQIRKNNLSRSSSSSSKMRTDPVDQYDDLFDDTRDEGSSLHKPLPKSNMGYKLLLKMGWKEGFGLGTRQQDLTMCLLLFLFSFL